MRFRARAHRTQRVASHGDSDSPVGDGWIRFVQERLREDANDLDALEAVGVWYLALGEPGKALDYFHRITRLNARYPGIWRLKAKAFEALGDRRNAERCSLRGSDPVS